MMRPTKVVEQVSNLLVLSLFKQVKNLLHDFCRARQRSNPPPPLRPPAKKPPGGS